MARRLPPLAALRPFEAAARLESFTKAADELHLTHGAVSHQVRGLEEHLGTALFARHGKRVTLTAAGRLFAEKVRAALEDLAAAAQSVRARRDDRLSVSVLPSFASRWLMPRLIRFMDANPGVEVNVSSSTALVDFAADEVDVAIRFGKGPWPGLVCEMFLEDEYFPVANPKLYRGKIPKTPQELAGARIIREDRDYWPQWFEAAGVPLESKLPFSARFNDSTYSLQAAARGEGVALARRSIVGEDCERGVLDRLFDIAIPSQERYWFVSPKETAQSPKVVAFRDWVRAELAANPKSRPKPKRKR